MSESEDRILMFHGTSTKHLDAILSRGMLPEPPVRLSALMAELNGKQGNHTASFDGTYMTVSHSLAVSYANEASKHMGGEGVVVAFSVPRKDLVPDEDEILFALAVPLALKLGWNSEEPEKLLGDWSREAAVSLARDFTFLFGIDDVDAAARVAESLDRMVSDTIGTDWDHDPVLFDPECNDFGWSSPTWIRKLTSTPEGMALYREQMDAMCRAMAGADPWKYPCELESCKGRILYPIGLDEGHECFIVSVGAPMDPLEHYDNTDALTGREIADLEAADYLRRSEMAMGT